MVRMRLGGSIKTSTSTCRERPPLLDHSHQLHFWILPPIDCNGIRARAQYRDRHSYSVRPRALPSSSISPTLPPAVSHVLNSQFRTSSAATGDLTLLLTAIQLTSKFIATNVRKARLINLCV